MSSDLIPSISFADFVKVVEAGKVLELKSCEVLLPDGSHDFNVVIFHGDAFSRDYARTQSEYLALRSNSIGGKDPRELLIEMEDGKCLSLNSVVTTVAESLKPSAGTMKSKKSGVRRVKAKLKGSGRRSALASGGVMTPVRT